MGLKPTDPNHLHNFQRDIQVFLGVPWNSPIKSEIDGQVSAMIITDNLIIFHHKHPSNGQGFPSFPN